MKNEINDFLLQESSLVELTHDNSKKVNGGFLPIVLAVVGVYAGLQALAYGAGCAYGLICKNI